MNKRNTLKVLALAAAAALTSPAALAQAKLKVGLMLPATGTYAALGTAIENGFRLHVSEIMGKPPFITLISSLRMDNLAPSC